MASGPHPPNPAELLASESMSSLQGDLEARADLVIFDTPPMGPFTDAVILAARASGTLLVVRAGSNRRALITNSLGALRKVGGTVVGTVLNMVEAKDLGNTSSSYYYYAPESYTLANPKAMDNGRASA
jgi:Mrp family chromosome partitioning ATPase